jgi:CRISPR-associated protein Csm2
MSYENGKNYSGNRNGQNRGGTSEISVTQTFEDWKYDSKWITDKADKSLIDFAEKAGKYMADMKLTNSKIRNVYGEIKRIQMGTFEKEKPSFYLLRPKVAYALGRDRRNKGLEMFKVVFDAAFVHVSDDKTYKNFCNLIEAILAYHKAYGGE